MRGWGVLEAVVDLLACPVCGGSFELRGPVLRCAAGHAFDLAAGGSVTLASPPGRCLLAGDTAAMVAARLAVLEAGRYDPLVAGLLAAVDGRGGVLADLGAGPGHYASALLDAGLARGVAVDVSAAAVRRAAARHPRLGAVRADVRHRLPLRDGAADVVLVVFAPRNPGEWSRVLAPGGRVVVAVPGDEHLAELRAAGALLGQEPDKVPHLIGALAGRFALERDHRVRWTMPLDAALAAGLAGMGPAAHHDRPAPASLPAETTGDVHVLTFRGAQPES